jgi:hypothetical protein
MKYETKKEKRSHLIEKLKEEANRETMFIRNLVIPVAVLVVVILGKKRLLVPCTHSTRTRNCVKYEIKRLKKHENKEKKYKKEEKDTTSGCLKKNLAQSLKEVKI